MAFEIFKMMGIIAINRNQALMDIQAIKQGTQKATKEMSRSFSKFTTDHSAQFKKVGMVSAAAGVIIGLAVKKMRGSFNEYESALVDMGKITDESLESIETRMKKLPPILGSLTDLTRGYYQIVSAGIKEPVEAIDTLTVSSQTAAAAHMNQSEVVKGLTKVMAGYEGQIEDVSEAADLMFAIEKEGQCLTGNTKILLSNGEYKRIDDLEGEVEVVSWDYRNFIPMRARFLDMGVKPTIEIKTTEGREITTTLAHPYLTPKGWKKVKDLKEEDRIAQPCSLPFFGNIKPKEGWATLLGYLLAEGTIQNGVARLTIADAKILKEVEKAANKYGIIIRKINQKDRTKCNIYSLVAGNQGGHHENPVINELRKYDLYGKNCYTKFIPKEVFSWKKDEMAKLLNAYFSGDGWLARKNSSQFELGFSSVSKQLLFDVSHLLLRFGINGRIRQRKRYFLGKRCDIWVWQTSKYIEIKRFIDFIGIVRPTVKDFLSLLPQGRSNSHNLIHINNKPRERKRFTPYKGFGAIDSQLAYVRIKEIKCGVKEHVYDLVVPKLHNFVANDILAHNTTVGELIPIIGSLATMSAQLKISQDEMGASMAVITKTAGSTAEASTELEGVFTGLMKPTEAMSAAIKGMGFATAEAAIEELGFVEVLRRLDEVTGGSSEKLGELFGRKQAILGVSKLTAEGMKILKDTIASVAEKTGMADEAYKDWMETGEGLNKQTKAVTENLLILIGKALDPMMDKLQTRLAGVIEGMGEWISLNPELTATIAQLTTGLGLFLIPFGAIMMMMPGLVVTIPAIGVLLKTLSAGFGLWAASLGLTAAGLGLALAGITAFTLYVSDKWVKAIEEGERILEAQIAATEAQSKALTKLIKAYDMTAEEVKYWIENHELSISVLARVREETRKLSEAKYGLGEVYGKVINVIKEAVITFEELDVAILNSVIQGKELSEQQEEYMALRQRMSDVDRTATQRKIDDLDRESIALLANMETNLMTMEQIDEYRQVMLQHIKAESSERQEHLSNMEDIENKLFKLTHTQTEIRIRDLEKRREAYIKTAEEAMLSAQKEEDAVIKINEAFEKEKASIYELAIVRSEKEIETLNKSIERRKEAGEAIDELIKKRDEEIENLKKLETGYEGVEEAAKKSAAAEAKRELYIVKDPKGTVVRLQDVWQMSSEEVAAGYTIEKLAKGGLIRPFTGIAKRLAIGGAVGTDTVPIMATPGEYLIKKGMVDFVRRTGMVTGGLIKAIGEGLPTPNPPALVRGVGNQSGGIVFGPGSIVISCKYLDWKTVNEAGDKIFDVVKRKAGNLGWNFGRS